MSQARHRFTFRVVTTDPFPLPLDEPDPDKRDLHCRKQDGCLAFAGERKWKGFSCELCRSAERLTPDEEQDDVGKLIELRAEIYRHLSRWRIQQWEEDA